MSEPHPELERLRAAHRRVRRPDPELRARVARAVAADRRREDARRWIGGSLVGAAMGVAALLVAHWVAVGVATRDTAERTPGEAEYQSPRDARRQASQPRGDGATRSEPTPAPAAPAPAGSAALQPANVDGAAAEPTPAATKPAPPPSEGRRPAPAPASTPADLAAEVRLLREAEVALSTDPAQALALLRAHVRKFPRTSLPLERSALQILARCATSPGDAAIRERDAFLREHPGSPYAARVRSACH